MSETKKDEEMIYGLTIDEREALRSGLRDLPETMPPRAVWNRIREQGEAEGLLIDPRRPRRSTWYAGGGIAAAMLLAAIIVPRLMPDAEPEFSAVPEFVDTGNVGGQLNVLEALMVESRQLENDLRALPSEPHVVSVGTQATILDLEDRIAAIDSQLSDPAIRLTPDERELFWRERVRLMKSLVRLRYAQAQRTAF